MLNAPVVEPPPREYHTGIFWSWHSHFTKDRYLREEQVANRFSGPITFFALKSPAQSKNIFKDLCIGTLTSLSCSSGMLGIIWAGGSWLNLYTLPPFQAEVELGIYTLLSMVIIGPASETLLLVFIMLLAYKVYPSRIVSLLAGTVTMSAVHSYFAWMWGLIVWPIFLVGGLNYLRWRSKGTPMGFAVAASIHALHNLVAASAMSLQ